MEVYVDVVCLELFNLLAAELSPRAQHVGIVLISLSILAGCAYLILYLLVEGYGFGGCIGISRNHGIDVNAFQVSHFLLNGSNVLQLFFEFVHLAV